MNKGNLYIVASGLVATLASLHPAGAAYAVDVFRFTGNSAIAQFSSSDPAQCSCETDPSCITTGVFVFAADSQIQNPPGAPETVSSANAFIFKSSCEEILLNAACFPSAPLADQDWRVGGGLNSATLRTRLECSESVSNVPFSVDVDLQWDGIGEMSRGNSHSNSAFPGCRVNTHSVGTIRPTVESGMIFDGVTNFTPDPSIPDVGDNITAGRSSQVINGCQ